MPSTNKLQEIASADITCDLDSYEAGSGSFGDVIIGYHEGLQQDVAIKVFAITGGPQEKAWLEKEIKEEVEHLQKADHENVVRVLGYVKWHCAMGIVMEYCKGGNLKELILDLSKELGLAVRVRFLYQTSSAMAFCHNLPDKRLIHQDLKSENVMLTEELQCKIIDFGAAELATYSGSTTVHPLARSKKERPQYTPYYTAPEKLKDPTMTPRTEHDIYSFGMIIFWALARKAPYPRLTQEDQRLLLQKIEVEKKRPDCQEIQDWIQTLVGEDREIAEQLQLLMKRCWDQDATKRPTMTEISEELKNLLEKQNPENLLSQVASIARRMVFNQPSTNKCQRVLLHYFSPRTGRFEVPQTTPDGTEKLPTEPPAGVQEEQTPPQQGKIPTSSKSQQLDQTRPARTLVKEIPHSSTSPQQPAGGISTFGKTSGFKRSLRKLFGFKTGTNPTLDSSSPASTGVQRSTESTEESSHSIKSPQQTAACLPTSVCYVGPSVENQLAASVYHHSTIFQNAGDVYNQGTNNQPSTEKDEMNDFDQRVQKYVDLIKTKKYDEAKTTKQQISKSLERLAVTAVNLQAEAAKRQDGGKYLESILFFSIAADFYVKNKYDSTVAKTVADSMGQIQEIIKLFIKNPDLMLKLSKEEIVRDYVIPLMRDMTQQIRDLQINEEIRCTMEAWGSYYIQASQDHIGDLESSETTIKLGLELMERKFGDESSKHPIYAILLNALGCVCNRTKRFKEAFEYSTKAIEAYKTADLDDVLRRLFIVQSETNLATANLGINLGTRV